MNNYTYYYMYKKLVFLYQFCEIKYTGINLYEMKFTI